MALLVSVYFRKIVQIAFSLILLEDLDTGILLAFGDSLSAGSWHEGGHHKAEKTAVLISHSPQSHSRNLKALRS